MANGQIQVEIVDTQKCLSAINDLKKQIAALEGANKVFCIWEWADRIQNEPCHPAGEDFDESMLPKYLKRVVGNDPTALLLCGIIQEWAELKGYGHSESKQGNTKG
jgi:hypothetical protein